MNFKIVEYWIFEYSIFNREYLTKQHRDKRTIKSHYLVIRITKFSKSMEIPPILELMPIAEKRLQIKAGKGH